MENFDQKNTDIIRKINPVLFNKLQGTVKKNNISVIVSQTGEKIPLININKKNISIHSKYDPVKEAERFIAEIDPPAFDLFIVFGFGFGYHVEVLAKRIKQDAAIIIIEKHPELIKEALSEKDLTPLLNDGRIKIIADPDEEEISEALAGLSSRKVSFLTHRGSFQTDPDYYTNLRQIVKSYLSVKDVNIATLSRFEKTWMANIARNIREFISLPGAEIFYGKFMGLPAIIAGAGPSLTGSLEFLRRHSERAVIICVDTSYKILIKNNIFPHFCLTVDAQLVNARYFEGCADDRTVFIADPCAHPSSFRLIKGKKAVFSIPFDMMKWIEEETGIKGELAYGGSVSTNAYDFAKRIGASPVILVGQDFAFTDNLAHARGAYLDEEVFFRTTRFFNMQMQNRYQLSALPKINVKGTSGGNVITNQKLMIFLNWFAKRNDPDLVNAATGGALINGVKHRHPDDIILPDISTDINKCITEIYKNSIFSEKAGTIRNILLQKSRKMLMELKELIPVVTRAELLSNELKGILKNNIGKEKIEYILKKLSETDKLLESKTSLKNMIGFTIQRVIHTITEGHEIDPEDSVLSEQELTAKKSHYLYKGMLEGSEFNLKKLNKMIRLLSA